MEKCQKAQIQNFEKIKICNHNQGPIGRSHIITCPKKYLCRDTRALEPAVYEKVQSFAQRTQ